MDEETLRQAGAPFDDFGLVQACRRLHTAIDGLDEKAARAIGVSRNDLRCLNLLEGGPVTPKSLADALGLTSGSVTTLLDRLETRGFVQRAAHPEDRRALLVSLQPAAFAQLGDIYRAFGLEIVALADRYGAQQAGQAATCLNDVSGICEQVCARFEG